MEHTKECLDGGYCNCATKLQNEIKTKEVIGVFRNNVSQ